MTSSSVPDAAEPVQDARLWLVGLTTFAASDALKRGSRGMLEEELGAALLPDPDVEADADTDVDTDADTDAEPDTDPALLELIAAAVIPLDIVLSGSGLPPALLAPFLPMGGRTVELPLVEAAFWTQVSDPAALPPPPFTAAVT